MSNVRDLKLVPISPVERSVFAPDAEKSSELQ